MVFSKFWAQTSKFSRFFSKFWGQTSKSDIANKFFRAGYIESWGRGMLKMIDECTKVGLPEPEFNFDFNGLMVKFKGKPTEVAGKWREKWR